ncbi:hypothetical protein BJV82DRAFT_362359 [Fennellomyces sp. T-0311]|nr:hypothetical protein BJV82DRAFT_362359 [Fennellomyces sp. T-0311]
MSKKKTHQKKTSFHVSAVVSCKQSKKAPSNFKITVLKDQSHKAYDFEAMNAKEARDMRKNQLFNAGLQSLINWRHVVQQSTCPPDEALVHV